MRALGLVLAGVLLGGGITYLVTEGSDQLDKGISHTYRCDQLAREADALKSSEKLLQQFLRDKSLSDLEAMISASGLDSSNFEKGDYTVVVVGNSPQTMALEFEVSQTGEIALGPIPGSKPCAP
ncbi:hypothetical protein [Labrenzia sp. R5_0]|jgi:membrane-bound inhibitor of C-type lysozyme|uniref:hypothetical protein n=1 Tax=Labrenzia sp. R5_0 TaxID=2821108 RepID=UPI001ADCE774|nr:hypothetical protein [Labrenzia sp. R5_0]MBO9460977.1 hypothetical protein [Labrenzia sp. R5_0]